MKHLIAILLCSTVVGTAHASDKPWTALVIYSDGHFVSHEDIKHEKTCREAICQIKDGMSCDEKAEYDRKAKEAAEKAQIERKAKTMPDGFPGGTSSWVTISSGSSISKAICYQSQ